MGIYSGLKLDEVISCSVLGKISLSIYHTANYTLYCVIISYWHHLYYCSEFYTPFIKKLHILIWFLCLFNGFMLYILMLILWKAILIWMKRRENIVMILIFMSFLSHLVLYRYFLILCCASYSLLYFIIHSSLYCIMEYIRLRHLMIKQLCSFQSYFIWFHG